jgi:hypothetical protein
MTALTYFLLGLLLFLTIKLFFSKSATRKDNKPFTYEAQKINNKHKIKLTILIISVFLGVYSLSYHYVFKSSVATDINNMFLLTGMFFWGIILKLQSRLN